MGKVAFLYLGKLSVMGSNIFDWIDILRLALQDRCTLRLFDQENAETEWTRP